MQYCFSRIFPGFAVEAVLAILNSGVHILLIHRSVEFLTVAMRKFAAVCQGCSGTVNTDFRTGLALYEPGNSQWRYVRNYRGGFPRVREVSDALEQ